MSQCGQPVFPIMFWASRVAMPSRQVLTPVRL